jgi:L-seryl-tRNA(Ser) seleniumtransferase
MSSLRNIPAIDELLSHPRVEDWLGKFNRDFIVGLIRQVVDATRQELKGKKEIWDKESLTGFIIERMQKAVTENVNGTLQKVVNGTGVVLHTNLGRAPLGPRAINYMLEMAASYNNLELDLEKGERGSRYQHVEELLVRLTGAEAGLVVNNNAAAVLLVLTTLAQGREVIVSRGQLVEIGGAFRIPEVMKASGAKLVEVGTTNKTYISDYAGAITADTALLFAAHTSNYKIIGFSEEVRLSELVRLGREQNIPVVQDLGSGILTDLGSWGLQEEPTVQSSVAAGADVITFSGDKLLGGPQAGIIVGKKAYIEAMKKNQLTRALRVDKLTIAALEGTLLEYLCGNPQEGIPVIRMLCLPAAELQARARVLKEQIWEQLGSDQRVQAIEVIPTEDMVGGGAYPTYKIPGYGLELAFKGASLEAIARRLRLANPALLTRRQEDKMLISIRTLQPGDEEILAGLLRNALDKEQAR